MKRNLEMELRELGTPEEIEGFREKELDLERMINRRIKKICLKVIGVVFVLILLLLAGISPLMKRQFLNPVKMEAENSGCTMYLRTYYETMQPYTEIWTAQPEDQGFSSYEIRTRIFSPIKEGELSGLFQMKKGRVTSKLDTQNLLIPLMGRFKMDTGKTEEIKKEIKKLPESACLYLSIGEAKERSLMELLEEKVQIEWVELYQEKSDFQGGLNMNMTGIWKETDKRKELSEKELKEVFVENLTLLLTEPELLKSLEVYSGSTVFYDLSPIKETREYFQQEVPLEVKNYCISGTRDEISDYLDTLGEASVLVDEIKLSVLG